MDSQLQKRLIDELASYAKEMERNMAIIEL